LDGSLWIGTFNGLNRFKDGKFTIYSIPEGLSNAYVQSIYEGADGTLWIGTRGGGLNRFKDGKFTAYSIREGLLDSIIYQILEDDKQNLWMGSNKGILRVAIKELDDFAAGKIKSISVLGLGKSDGMKNLECNSGSPAGVRTKDGKLWFSTLKGVAALDPNRLELAQKLRQTLIEQVWTDNQQVAFNEKALITPGKRELEILYTVPDFIAPEKIKFKPKCTDKGSTEAKSIKFLDSSFPDILKTILF
jgi:ligand-binding sensor domain-containing protein